MECGIASVFDYAGAGCPGFFFKSVFRHAFNESVRRPEGTPNR
jgi:hypothetical protein